MKQFFKHASSVLIDGAGVDEWLATALSVKQKVEEIVNIFIQRMAKKKTLDGFLAVISTSRHRQSVCNSFKLGFHLN